MIPVIIAYLITLQLFIVSLGDIIKKKIPNFWPLLNLILFPILCWLYPEFYRFHWGSFIFPLAFLIVGFFLFLLRIMGGGDSKYLFSLFLIIPLQFHERMFEYLLYTTFIIGSFVLLTNLTSNLGQIVTSLKTGDYNEVKKYFGTKFAYAPVILIAWIWLGITQKIFVF